jgi:hypothetical protein
MMDEKSNLQNKSASSPALNSQMKQRAKTAPNSQLNQLKSVCEIYFFFLNSNFVLFMSVFFCLLYAIFFFSLNLKTYLKILIHQQQ